MNAPTHMLPEDLQRTNEYRFCRKHLDTYLNDAIRNNPQWFGMVTAGTELVNQWLNNTFYESKQQRLEQLKHLDLEELILQIMVASAYFQRPQTLVTVTSLMAHHLGFDDRRDAILTVAELVAVVCWTGAFTLWKDEPDSSMMFISNLQFSQDQTEALNRAMYPLPMVCEPEPVTSNFHSPYLTFNDCRILGKKNGHTGDICLDVLNTQMRVPLKLNLQFLSTVDEPKPKDWETLEQQQNWDQFKQDSYRVYHLIAHQTHRFWLDQKVDKRGRIYAQGYHITTQGSPFKKAMIELANEEYVEGVPQ